jgi:hypothetical protein
VVSSEDPSGCTGEVDVWCLVRIRVGVQVR